MAVFPDPSISGAVVAHERDAVVARPPQAVVSDQTEATCMALQNRSEALRVDRRRIAPGKPQRNAFV